MTSAIASNEGTSLRGVAMGAAAYSLFAFHDALVKSIISDLPVTEILFVRSLVIVLGCLVIGRQTVLRDLRSSSGKHLILLRGVLTLGAWCMYYSMGRYLQLAAMTTLYYVAPIITLVLAVISYENDLRGRGSPRPRLVLLAWWWPAIRLASISPGPRYWSSGRPSSGLSP